MPAKQFQDTDSFLGHTTRSKSKFVRKWKDETDDKGLHSLIAWFHTKQRPFAVWVHGFPKIIIKKEDDEEKRITVFSKYNCWEEEDVLKEQFFRNKEDDKRKNPPKVCGFCLFIEWMYWQVKSGAVPWTKPIFRFEHEDPRKTIIIHAAGLYNGFRGELTKEKKEELRDAGISMDRSWGENAQAKCDYVMTIVDHRHVEDGAVILQETSLVGDKLKDLLAAERERSGAEKGDPWRNPYAIKFLYNKDEQPMKKYTARALTELPITPEIKKLIEGDPPDIDKHIAPFNPKEMRTFLETHCLLKNVPWDELFSKHANVPMPSTTQGVHSADDDTDAGDEEEAGGADDDMVACDKCDKPMKATDTKCAHCGAEYEVEGATPLPPPPPPPKQVKKRSEIKKDKVPF